MEIKFEKNFEKKKKKSEKKEKKNEEDYLKLKKTTHTHHGIVWFKLTRERDTITKGKKKKPEMDKPYIYMFSKRLTLINHLAALSLCETGSVGLCRALLGQAELARSSQRVNKKCFIITIYALPTMLAVNIIIVGLKGRYGRLPVR